MKDKIEKRMDIAKLFADHLANPAKEKEELDSLFKEEPTLHGLFDDITAGINEANWEPTDKQEWITFQKKFLHPRHHRRNQILRYAAAACFFMTITIALSLFFTRQEKPHTEVASSGNLPTLSVSDEVYSLDAAGIEHLNQQTHSSIQRTNGGLTYSLDTVTPAKREWHTVQVPQQTEFALTLADGSRVRLNANTHLRYAVPFSDTLREVWVEGEAFFEVCPNKKKPFVVHFENNSITVLGTTFNVSCYKNEPSYTTLLSGSVCLRNSFEAIVLTPGQEGIILPAQKNITVWEADLKVSTAWLNDHFYFKEEPLTKIMETLGKWYGLEIEFEEDQLGTMLFSVETKRYGDIDSVLKIIESTGKVSFTEKNNAIKVKRHL